MDFKDCLSFDAFSEFEARRHNGKPHDVNAYHKELHEVFHPALKKFFMGKLKEGSLYSDASLVGHDIMSLTEYNNLALGKQLTEREENRVYAMFAHKIAFGGYYYSEDETRTPDSIKEKYQSMVEKMNQGNFRFDELRQDHGCQQCGQRIFMDFENWKPKLTGINLTTYQFETPKSCLSKANVKARIEFKTGNLIMADWFRIPAFTEYFKKKYDFISIESAAGQIEKTKMYAKENIIHVFVSNTSPGVFQRGNTLAIGHYQDYDTEESGSFEKKGFICTDLWWATILEKEKLLDILTLSLGQEDAEKALDEYLTSDVAWTIHETKVEPGVYSLRFNGNFEDFSSHLDKKIDFDELKNIEPFFVVQSADFKPVKKKTKTKP